MRKKLSVCFMIFLSISCVSENVNDFKRNQQLTVSVSKDIKLRCYKDDSSDVYFTIIAVPLKSKITL